MEKVIDFLNSYIFGPGLCVTLFACGIFLLFYLRFFFIRHPRKIVKALKTVPSSGISPLKAMLVALAGTLGVGNIAGVASAISVGGSGSLFWMLIGSIAAVPVKYAEIVLARRHRQMAADGKYHGGAFYYIRSLGGKFPAVLAVIFALMCVTASLSMGCTLQANALATSVNKAFSLPGAVVGLVLAVLTFLVASGGLERISFVTSKLIPLMSAAYILMSLYVIFANLPLMGEISREVLAAAFTPQSVGGGIVGIITSRAMRMGVTRGIVSNEAGCGTAPIAHCEAEVKYPAVQGVWGIVEVIIDTPVMCTLTALVVLISEKYGISLTGDGMSIAVDSFGRFIPFSEYIICAAITVFAFCTIICWFFYGSESLRYLNKKASSRLKSAYLVIYSLCTFLGAVGGSDFLWGLSDLTISCMTALNILILLICRKEIKRETDVYFE